MPKNSSAGVGVPEAKYGNWVALRLIYVPGLVGGGFLALSFWSAVLVIPAALFFTVAGYFAYARFLFAPQGGNVQSSVWRTLLSHLEWDGRGRALDVGCGSGALTILLAKTYQGATVTGIDNWGKGWEYSKSLCDRNAAVEGVGARVDFQQGTASSLQFPDETFDVVVSNLTFHEVKDAPDKRLLIKEALRVLKKGGKFAFQDLFLLKRTYGDVGILLESMKGWGVKRVDFEESWRAPYVPRALKLPFMIGTMGLVSGEK